MLVRISLKARVCGECTVGCGPRSTWSHSQSDFRGLRFWGLSIRLPHLVQTSLSKGYVQRSSIWLPKELQPQTLNSLENVFLRPQEACCTVSGNRLLVEAARGQKLLNCQVVGKELFKCSILAYICPTPSDPVNRQAQTPNPLLIPTKAVVQGSRQRMEQAQAQASS